MSERIAPIVVIGFIAVAIFITVYHHYARKYSSKKQDNFQEKVWKEKIIQDTIVSKGPGRTRIYRI